MVQTRSIRKQVRSQTERLLETGNRFKSFDQIRQRHFWSTYRFTPDANGFVPSGDFDVFQTPAGQAGQGYLTQLTLRETNWPSANRVPDNQNFEITEIGVSAQVSASASVALLGLEYNSQVYHLLENEVLRNLVVSITYLTNQIPMGMATDFAQASGPNIGLYEPNMGISTATPPVIVNPDRRRTFVQNGFGGPALRRKFRIPILLQHGETFKFTYSIPQGRSPYVAKIDPSDAAWPYIDVRLDFWATESYVEKS